MADVAKTKKEIKKWVRVSFNGLKRSDYSALIKYVERLTNYIGNSRFFFLFEENPEFMLQIETQDIEKVRSYVKKKRFKVTNVSFIENPEEKNPLAIEFYCLGAKHAILRLKKKYKDVYLYPNMIKIFHCLCNQAFQTWEDERSFYYRCILARGPKLSEIFPLMAKIILTNLNLKITNLYRKIS